jgi:uncharacterized protein (TIGR02466 family)
MIKKTEINYLFPTPIYMAYMDRKFTKKELQFTKDQRKNCINNVGNYTTKDSYVLNKKELKDIKKFIEKCCKDFLEKLISPANDVELYITQSWLNYTKQKEFHHQHSHPNSIVSGVLYFDSYKDSIIFTNPKAYQAVKPEVKNYNIYNSEIWQFTVETGQLILFPSDTIHQVYRKEGNNVRTSLAFNTFYKGTIGTKDGLTELHLK